jgi:hypothetical protein
MVLGIASDLEGEGMPVSKERFMGGDRTSIDVSGGCLDHSEVHYRIAPPLSFLATTARRVCCSAFKRSRVFRFTGHR